MGLQENLNLNNTFQNLFQNQLQELILQGTYNEVIPHALSERFRKYLHNYIKIFDA